MILTKDELKSELDRLNRRVLQIMLTFAKRKYPNDKSFLSIISRTSREINVDIDWASKIRGIAYFSNFGQIRVVPKFFELNEVEKIDVLLHEYAHALNSYNARAKYDFLEEGYADLFAEVMVNDWIFNQEGLKKIPKLIRENFVDGYSDYAHGYTEERQIAKDIMIIFIQHNESFDQQFVNFIIGNNNFYKSAESINGESAHKLFQYIRDSIITTKYNNSSEFYEDTRNYAYAILERALKDYKSKDISKKMNQSLNTVEGVCFSNNIGLTIIYNVKLLEETLGPDFDYQHPTKEAIDEIKKKGASLVYAACTGGYIPEKFKTFIIEWFKKCNGNLKEFDYILSLFPNVPDELLVDILKTNPKPDSDFIYYCLKNYGISRIEDQLYVERILNNDRSSKSKIEVEIFMLKDLRPFERTEAITKIVNEIDFNQDYDNIYTLASAIKSVIYLPELPYNISQLTSALNRCRKFLPKKNKSGEVTSGNIIRESMINKEKKINCKIYEDYCDVYTNLAKYHIVLNHNATLEKIKAGAITVPPLKLNLVEDYAKIEVLTAVAEILKNINLRYFIDDLKKYIKDLYLDIKDSEIKEKFNRILNYDDYLNMLISDSESSNDMTL